ncbi:MAG: hypothetical protein WC052_04880, partial [Patescibacteria group bacterium]
MMLITHLITKGNVWQRGNVDPTPLIVGEVYDDAVLAMMPDRRAVIIPRYLVETPILCCPICGKAALLKEKRFSKDEYTECPDYNRHMYEKLYAASHDVKNHSRAARRSMWKQAGRHLAEWKKP